MIFVNFNFTPANYLPINTLLILALTDWLLSISSICIRVRVIKRLAHIVRSGRWLCDTPMISPNFRLLFSAAGLYTYGRRIVGSNHTNWRFEDASVASYTQYYHPYIAYYSFVFLSQISLLEIADVDCADRAQSSVKHASK